MTMLFDLPVDFLAILGREGLALVGVPLVVWTLVYLPARAVLRTPAFVHADARYYGHLALLASLPLGIALAVLVQLVGPAAPQLKLAVLPPIVVGIEAAAAEEMPPAPVLTGWHLLGAAVLALGLYAGGRLLVLGLTWLRARPLRTGDAAPQHVRALVDETRASLGLRRAVRIVIAPAEVVPMTSGLLRPIVVLPAPLLDDERALRLALTHELVHVARFDAAAYGLERVTDALFDWHPAVRQLTDKLPGYRELACDAAVLALHRTHAKPYAQLLLRYATLRPTMPLPAVSMADAPSTIKTRIQAMQSTMPTPFRRLGFALSAVLLALVTLTAACTDVASMEEPPAADETSAEVAAAKMDGEVYETVDEMPELIGGIAGVAEKLRYPEEAKEMNVEGRVVVQFIVDANGDVQNAQVVKGLGAGLDKEALRVTEELKFVPGKQNGKAVNVELVLPITFKLPND